MAKATQKTEQTTDQSSLEDFNWDTPNTESFFGVAGTEVEEAKPESVDSVIKQVIGDDDDEDDEITEINKKNKAELKAKEKEKTKAKDTTKKKAEEKEEGEDGEEDEGEEAEFFQDGAEDEEDEDAEEDGDEDKNKTKEKKEKIKPEDKDKKVEKSKAKPEAAKTDGEFFKQLTVEMKERGFFQTVEIPEDKEELEEDEFFELADQEIEGRINETFEAFFEEMDEDGKDFLKFKKNGGRSIDFINVYANSPVPDFDGDFDSSNDTHKAVVIETYLSLVEKMDAEEIKDRMDWIKENGKDKNYAEKYYGKLQEIDLAQKTALLKQQEENNKKRDEVIKKFNKSIGEAITKADVVGNFKFTKEDKKKLPDFITKPTVKIGKNKYIPAFNSKLGEILKADTPEAQEKFLLLAKLIENNFNVAELATKAETKVTQKIKSKLRDVKNGVKPSSSGSYTRKSLSDFFNE
jgi:hypothetical protein